MKTSLIALAVALAISPPAHAQEAPATGDAPAPEASAQPAPDTTAPVAGRQVYRPSDFARFAPRNAYDILLRIPGFALRENEQLRGLGQATGNVLFNGERPSTKSDTLITQLSRIPAANVTRIEVVDGATLDLPGLSGQVANIIYSADALSGQVAWLPAFRAHHTDPLLTRGSVSVSGRTGPVEYQVGLDNENSARSGAGGSTVIYDATGAVTERREEVWTADFDTPKLHGRLTFDGPGSSVGHLNAHYQGVYETYNEDGFRSSPGQPDRTRTVRDNWVGWNYEIGGDYDFSFGPGRLKLVGLRRYNHEPYSQEIIVRPVDGSPATGERFAQAGRLGETIGRGEYSWKMLSGDWQLSAEAAYNTLDNVATLGTLQPDGGFSEAPFATASGGVDEDRYEALLSYGRPLSPTLSMQIVAGAEHSTIAQTGADGLSRSFLRPKGSMTLSWKPSNRFDISAKLRRRVLQLSFYDFLARAFLNDGNENAGNADLRPQQDWSVEIEANRNLGAWGSTKLRLIYRDVTDYVDVIPVGGGESVGNVPKSWAGAIDWTGTLQFEPIGWKGARLESRVLFQKSSLRDPFTGERRQWSGFTDRLVDLTLRHDVPHTNWAYGGNMNYAHYQPRYRGSQIDLLYEGPVFASLFVEHKDVFGLTVRAQASNLLNARSRREREFFDGLRGDASIISRESRDRLIGPIFSLSVKGSF